MDMKKLRVLWSYLLSNFWFVPLLTLALFIVLSFVALWLDEFFHPKLFQRWTVVFGLGTGGARGMLSTIANSMMSIVGITFSITIVILSLVSSQYTSRTLSTFMRSHFTQFVLGSFIGIYTYCLIILKSVSDGSNDVILPHISTSIAMILALFGAVILVFFIHHIASSIQVSRIIREIGSDAIQSMDVLFPEKLGEAASPEETYVLPDTWRVVSAPKSGYLKTVDEQALERIAKKKNLLMKIEPRIGDFIVQQTPIVNIAFLHEFDEELLNDVRSAFVIGAQRSIEQDLAFGIRQLVDIALKALSPGVNDTTTAVMCVDYLTAILVRLVTREIPSNFRLVEGSLRVITNNRDFSELLALAIDQIYACALGNAAVQLALLRLIERVISQTENEVRRADLRQALDRICEEDQHTYASSAEYEQLRIRRSEVLEACNTCPNSKGFLI